MTSENNLSIETLLAIRNENDFRELHYCNSILERIFKENRVDLLPPFFNKIVNVFYFSDLQFRQRIISQLYEGTRILSDSLLGNMLSDSVVGNLVLLHNILKRSPIINGNNLSILTPLWNMRYLHDSSVLPLYPFEHKFILDVESSPRQYDKVILEKVIDTLETLFDFRLVKRSKDTSQSFLLLYSSIDSASFRFKAEILKALLNANSDTFLYHLAKLGVTVSVIEGLVEEYENVYRAMKSVRLPIYFDALNLQMAGELVNDNAFPLIVEDNEGKKKIIFPYQACDSKTVQGIYDPLLGDYIIPKGRFGKLFMEEIHSFAKVAAIDNVTPSKLDKVKQMTEVEMEEKLRFILKDENSTADSPAERTDIFAFKIRISGTKDLRDAAFILKGRGYPKVTLNKISTNLLKAISLPADLIVVVHVGSIEDEPLEHLKNLCNDKHKMFCVIQATDFARLLEAFGLLD